MKVLVAYASKHGSTQGIAQAIAGRLQELGHQAQARAVHDVTDLGDAQAIVLGSALYAGSWMKEAVEFVHRNAAGMSRVPVWLFSSGPLGDEVKDHEEQPRQLPELTQLCHPKGHRIFFGALDHDTLGFGERMLVKAVKAPNGDFRDWGAIKEWSESLAQDLS